MEFDSNKASHCVQPGSTGAEFLLTLASPTSLSSFGSWTAVVTFFSLVKCSGVLVDAQTTPTAEKHNDLEGLLSGGSDFAK